MPVAREIQELDDPGIGLIAAPASTGEWPHEVWDELRDRLLDELERSLGPERADALDGAVRHEPQGREVDRFEDGVADSVRLRRELGALP